MVKNENHGKRGKSFSRKVLTQAEIEELLGEPPDYHTTREAFSLGLRYGLAAAGETVVRFMEKVNEE